MILSLAFALEVFDEGVELDELIGTYGAFALQGGGKAEEGGYLILRHCAEVGEALKEGVVKGIGLYVELVADVFIEEGDLLFGNVGMVTRLKVDAAHGVHKVEGGIAEGPDDGDEALPALDAHQHIDNDRDEQKVIGQP